MTIWTSKPFCVLGVLAFLGACDEALDPSTLLAGLTPPEDAALPAVPLTQALMMRGKVTLVPPAGYCIDPDSLSQSFALMGRCDAMGAATGGPGAPAGLLTVSVARSAAKATLPSAQEIADAANLGPPRDLRESDGKIIFKTTGTAPGTGLAPEHWRAVAKLDRFTIGAALYGPEGRRAVSGEGASLLEEMLKKTSDKTTAG